MTHVRPGSVWRSRGICYRYVAGARDALDHATFGIDPGRVTALVGPNGSGKSTLIRILLGILTPTSGRTLFLERDMAEWDRREIARRVGVMAQHETPAFPITVRELVAAGRFPHLGNWRAERAVDRAVIQEAMERCGVAMLHDRHFSTLSGGERQRARLARALAQEPLALVLDEPTAGLDVAAEMVMWDLLRRQASGGSTVLLSTHNLNFAARFADTLLLLTEGRIVASGEPAAVLTESVVESAYGCPMRIVLHPGPGADTGSPQIVPLHVEEER